MLPWITAAATLGSALVGGAVGVTVTWMAHIFTDRRERRRYCEERAAIRREKLRELLEEIVTLVLEHGDALTAAGSRLGTLGISAANPGSTIEVPPEPNTNQLDRAEALQRLYFPSLADEFRALRVAVVEYWRFKTAETDAMAADVAAWNRDRRADFGTRLGQSLMSHITASRALIASARTIIATDLVETP